MHLRTRSGSGNADDTGLSTPISLQGMAVGQIYSGDPTSKWVRFKPALTSPQISFRERVPSKVIFRVIVFGAVVVMLTAGAIALSAKLPRPAAALESIDPAIVTTHLQALQGELALP